MNQKSPAHPTPAGSSPEAKALTNKIYLAGSIAFALHAIKNALLVYVLFFFAATGLSYFKDADNFPAIAKTIGLQRSLEAPPLSSIKQNVPTDFNGRDISKWLLYGGAYLLSVLIGSGAESAGAKRARLQKQKKAALEAAAASTPELLRKAAALKAGKLDRNQLLEIYAETKRSLETHKKNLAFLSIDIVDSTGMKIGEEVSIAERDFRQYKEMVQKIIAENKGQKSTWTPDGVMICFGSAADAVKAAQAVIISLGLFNKNVKTIKRDFRIRAGINAGEIFCDDATPMEEMTDRVIDIAGHMQKHGVVDGVAISKHAIEPLLGQFKFNDAKRIVDDCPVYEWTEASQA